MIRFCIVEDDDAAAINLGKCIQKYATANGLDIVIERRQSAEAFFKSYKRDTDIVFIDIELPGENGMDAARRLRELDAKVVIIFVTNLAQYAVGGYEVGAFDFIVKPVKYPSFALKLRRALKQLFIRRGREIWVTTRQGKKLINTGELKYVEVMKHVITYHLEKEAVVGSGTLKNVVEQLEGLPFVMCNRCYLVNLKYVTEINGNTVTVGGDGLLISAPRRHEFLTTFNDYLGAGGGG